MNMHDLDPELQPWSRESESSVLGGLLLDNGAWDRVGDILQAKHFYDLAHGRIYSVIGSLINSNKPADIFTVLDRLQTMGIADGIDIDYLHALAQYVPSAANIRRYSEIVAERALMRGLLEAADKVKALAVEPGIPVLERLDQSQALLQALHTTRGRAMPTAIDESVVRLLDRVQDLSDGNVNPGIPTRFHRLNKLIGGGLKGGKQIIIAARPSIGKSSLAEQLCIHLALDDFPAAIFSMEMSKDELTDRAVANIGDISLDFITSGQLTNLCWPKLTDAVEKIRLLPLYLDDQPALTLHDIAAKARMLKRQCGIRLIVLDYLQLCAGDKGKDNRHHQIEELSRGIKSLAKQLDVCFITLSQLNRAVEQRPGGRPILSDLKESGSIEEDADIVMLLSRASTTPDGFQTILCDIPKNRQGRTGSIALGFDGAHQRWHETTMPADAFKPASKHYTEDV